MTEADIDRIAGELRALLEERLRVRGRDLSRQLKRAGRRIPRARRRDGAMVVAALEQARHPRLSRMIDESATRAAAKRLADWLRTVDPWEARKDRLLGIAGSIAFGVLVLSALVIWLLVERGLV